MIDFKHSARPRMDAVESEEFCALCAQRTEQSVLVSTTIAICQPCINQMYAKACAAFNVRPDLTTYRK